MTPTPRWKDPHWQFNALILTIVILSVGAILCTPLICRGAGPVRATSKPILMIDHNAYSKASRELLAEYKRTGSTLAPWLRERYTIRWRCAWPTADLPRFWRGGRLVGNGWAGEQRLRLLLGDVPPAAIASPATVTVIDSQVSGLRSSLASVESRFEQADQKFTDELTALGEQLGTQFGDVDSRLDETDRRMAATTDRNLVAVRERRGYKKAFAAVKQQQAENTTLIGTLTAKFAERIKQAAPDGLWGMGVKLTQGLAIAGIIGTGGLGGGLGGWLLLKAGGVLRRRLRGKPDEEDDGVDARASTDCPECRVNRATIESLRKQVNEGRKRPPISGNIRENLAASEADVRQLVEQRDEVLADYDAAAAENRSMGVEIKTLRAELKKCRDRPQPTERIIRVPDDSEQRWRRAMEMVRREFPTTPSYDGYRKLVEKHYALLKSGDGITDAD